MRLFDFGLSDGIDLWRSEEMMLAKLMIPSESAHGVIEALGDLGVMQFKDLNAEKTALQRTYCNEVKRCDEMSRKLRFFHEQVNKEGETVVPRLEHDCRGYDFDALESKLEATEAEMIEMNSNHLRLMQTYAELTELQIVLEKAAVFFDHDGRRAEEEFFHSVAERTQHLPLLEAGIGPEHLSESSSRVGFIAGTIPDDKMCGFERLLFRATRGNMYLRHQGFGSLRDPGSGEDMAKSVFVVFYAGDKSKEKVSRICDAFHANRYPFPEEISKQHQMHKGVTDRLRELATTNSASERRRDNLLKELASTLDAWTCIVRREKAIYHTLNKFSVETTSKVLIAEAWIPVAKRYQANIVLRQAAEDNSTQLSGVLQPVATLESPPTHFTTNKFTACFQTIVESYGVARYREVNPAVLTLMTFPFLFAVMFGDLGHGFILLMVALYLTLNERSLGKQDLGDMLGMLFGGRYCILLMALFSIYTGIIYNEFFSMPMAIFGHSKWDCYSKADGTYMDVDYRDCEIKEGEFKWIDEKPYDFGIDPIWHGTTTELPFLNSVKMKMSILLGVLHMNFGILMSLFNNQYYRDRLSTICEFIPQMIFLNFIFGYLCILIIVKWAVGSTSDLYNVMIYMFLGLGKVTEGNEIFTGQQTLQTVLLAVAIAAVPVMLLPKPFILQKRHERMMKHKRHLEMEMSTHPRTEGLAGEPSVASASSHVNEKQGHDSHDGHGEFDFSEVMVHQMIHTIEFVLGAVSNTASYLRLWALSLAHSQLSAVFYDRVMMSAIETNNVVAIFCAFIVFACATLGVLMVMESLSAFLHALRLHWVEFMNKFYKGDGYLFTPFCFKAIEEADQIAGQ